MKANLTKLLVVAVCVWALYLAWVIWGHNPDIKEPTLATICQSNLKQLALAIRMYAQDYEGRCPADAASPTLVGSMRLLSNYCSSAKILCCPSAGRKGTAVTEGDFAKITARNISYSYVPNLIWSNAAGRSIVALDRIDATSAGSSWPSTGNHNERKFIRVVSRGGNVLFSDGSVQFFRTLPSALNDKDGKEIVLSP